MNKVSQLHWTRKFIFPVSMAFSLSGCPLNVNLNVATDKPIAVYLVVDKPIKVKLDAGIAVTKLPPVKVDAVAAVTKLPPIKVGVGVQ
ncbi:hypothetical protein F6R98_13480 [Candidatus Methylospira mobilis]|uniref:Lipoprotein n=1 Tax=Candidatus Methylospira mobilis TaxID=1808979 RepID=A0A5Q0BI00_9GAMM|nr:hypothetical protein [Candidatus Methylospira mobilis]QFY43505.1 hypothetical protein F6R98_13480 [Candidatus Methylospira mobilis]